MRILVVCSQGENRSKYLARYLKQKGLNASFGGVKPDAKNPVTQKEVSEADVIITVRSRIKKVLISRFNVTKKKIIELEVHDNPERHPAEAQELAKKSIKKFQEKYVYSELRRQIQPYMRELKLKIYRFFPPFQPIYL